jgi:hypothetical protein
VGYPQNSAVEFSIIHIINGWEGKEGRGGRRRGEGQDATAVQERRREVENKERAEGVTRYNGCLDTNKRRREKGRNGKKEGKEGKKEGRDGGCAG